MPDFWTHILGGDLVTKEMKASEEQKYVEMIKKNQELFNLGCEGPDIFFYNDFWPWISEKRGAEIGDKLHQEQIKKLFATSLNFLKDNQDNQNFPQLFAYLSGFIVHYALDKRIHPFIYQETNNFPEHKNLEINIDTYLTNKYWNKLAHRMPPTPAIDAGHKLPKIVEEYYHYLLEKLNIKYKSDVINDSYQDFKRVFGLFYSRWRFKRYLFKAINPLLSFDLNTLIYPTRPDYKLLSSNDYNYVENLLLKGVGEAHNILKEVIKFINGDIGEEELKSTFPNINFDGVKI
ncbi:zinc dependent phospholipase C family protein [Halanaerobacter jeridensis]|uniref:Phospholipase C/D domain-containing protein n=1 Tax=Halanaerobacter jeridensis TaxID=706427 RepID=A0A939BP93_9FIRM|nr:zinc dependent phospholipase C family protein [Halanaerobacter jeridensis]MBM7556508.1 hypothetical protein [Halanaerobacter jeridensis]